MKLAPFLGINQLKRLNKSNLQRTLNFRFFLRNLDENKYLTDFNTEGSCAFPIVLKTNNLKKRNRFEKILSKYNIEFRRGNAGGGNQLRQPYLKILLKKI